MAHKTLIKGTVYEIDGGKAMVDGTVYEIDNGTTLVDGTAYEVGFAPPMVTVTLTGWSDGSGGKIYAYVEIDGTQYTVFENTTTLTVPVGTLIYCKTTYSSKDFTDNFIYLNGTLVANGGYTYTATVNATIRMEVESQYNSGRYNYAGVIYITET